MDLQELQKEFPLNEIEWRVQRAGKTAQGAGWAIIVPYVSNRAIMRRLDEVCGAENWKNEYKALPFTSDGCLCGISIKTGDEWVTKWDGAELTELEPVKGGLSNAMKRAAVQWGIGRYLYSWESPIFAVVSEAGRFTHYDKKTQLSFRWDVPEKYRG